MLGVRRTTVTEIAGEFERMNLIANTYGRVAVRDRRGSRLPRASATRHPARVGLAARRARAAEPAWTNTSLEEREVDHG
jgi:hypothetical protein